MLIYCFDSTFAFCEILHFKFLLFCPISICQAVRYVDIRYEDPLYLSPHFVMVPIFSLPPSSTSLSTWVWLVPKHFLQLKLSQRWESCNQTFQLIIFRLQQWEAFVIIFVADATGIVRGAKFFIWINFDPHENCR